MIRHHDSIASSTIPRNQSTGFFICPPNQDWVCVSTRQIWRGAESRLFDLPINQGSPSVAWPPILRGLVLHLRPTFKRSPFQSIRQAADDRVQMSDVYQGRYRARYGASASMPFCVAQQTTLLQGLNPMRRQISRSGGLLRPEHREL